MKILVIDDEPLILNLLGKLISREGHIVSLANNGTEGVELAKRNSFDLVLTDLRLSDISSNELLHHLKKVCLRIVLMTGELHFSSPSPSPFIRGILKKPFPLEKVSLLLRSTELEMQQPS